MEGKPNNAEGFYKSIKIGNFDELISEIVKIISSNLTQTPNYTFALLSTKKDIEQHELPYVLNRIFSELRRTKVSFKQENIRISTVHTFKGEEADCVVLLDASSKSFPPPPILRATRRVLFGDTSISDMIDAHCLFYVAITRARHSLYFIYEGTQSSYLKMCGID